MLSKYKEKAEREISPVYFNSTAKTVIRFDSLDGSFQVIFNRFNWISEGSGWGTESIDGEYVNISIYNLLTGSSYVDLPGRLKNSKKGLISIKNDDNKSFFWCHIRHLNPLKTHPERIAKADRHMVNGLD